LEYAKKCLIYAVLSYRFGRFENVWINIKYGLISIKFMSFVPCCKIAKRAVARAIRQAVKLIADLACIEPEDMVPPLVQPMLDRSVQYATAGRTAAERIKAHKATGESLGC